MWRETVSEVLLFDFIKFHRYLSLCEYFFFSFFYIVLSKCQGIVVVVVVEKIRRRFSLYGNKFSIFYLIFLSILWQPMSACALAAAL